MNGRRKVIVIIALLIFSAIVLAPPIVHGYVYPNVGDDTANHMSVFDTVKIGAPVPKLSNYAYYIVGYPLDAVSRVFQVDKDTLFLWFNFLALIGVGMTLCFVFTRLVGLTAGLLALVLPIFSSFGFLLLFYSGVIFHIINVGIIFPLAWYATVRWLVTKKIRYAFGAVILTALFAVFHTTGIYLPFIIMGGLGGWVAYKMVRHEHLPNAQVAFVIGTACCGIILFLMFGDMIRQFLFVMERGSGEIFGLPLLQESLLHYMSPIVLAVMLIALFMLAGQYRRILSLEKLAVAPFFLMAVIMVPPVLFGWSPVPARQGLDLAISLSLVAVGLVGIVARLDKNHIFVAVLVGLVAVGGLVNMVGWIGGYNSTLEKVDIAAIDYVNTVEGNTYSVTDAVDHWIYNRYVDKEYLSQGGDILITRNVPMKSKVALVEDGDWIFAYKEAVKTFTDNDVEIGIWK